MPLKITLKKPMHVNEPGKGAADIAEIEFRDPGADDFFECGMPGRTIQNFDQANRLTSIEVIFDKDALRRWAVRLSGRTPSELGQMSIPEVMQFNNWLGAEFNPSGN